MAKSDSFGSAGNDFLLEVFADSPVAFVLNEVLRDESGKIINYRHLVCNPAFGEMTGSDHLAVAGKLVTEAFPGIENDPADWIGTFGRIVDEQAPIELEQESVLLNRIYKVHAFPAGPERFAVLFEDATSLHRAEQMFSTLFDLGAVGMAITSLEKGWLHVNPALCQIMGYSEAELKAKTWVDLTHPDDIDKDIAEFERLVAGEIESYTIDKRFVRKDGGLVHSTIWVTVARNGQGEIEYFVAHIMDITDRVLAEDKVHELNRTLDERVRQRTAELTAANEELESFAYSVSHDLRAPLRAIEGFTTALSEDYGSSFDETADDYMSRIRAAASKMAKLIDDMLLLSRLTRLDMAVTDVDATAMAHSINDGLRREYDGSHTVTIEEGMVACADPTLAEVAIRNLLENAYKYSAKSEDPAVAVSSETDGDFTRIIVRDNGVGFDPKYTDKLFKPFQRLHREEEFSGTGVGLATVRRVASRHGGKVGAESEIGEGSTFWISLPRERRSRRRG